MTVELSKIHEKWIYQSNKLIESSYSFTVLEQKLIRILASMIRKDDEEFKEYQFKATELSTALNIHKGNIYRELDQITDKLMSRYVKIKNDTNEKFKKRHLIKTADFENGILTMQIDEDMKDFFLKLNWYTRYQLKNIMQFKSTYSFRLYELLKQYESIGSRTILVDDLRTILEIDDAQYPKYANLKQKVINVAVNEINQKTDIYVKLEENKVQRKIISIKLNIRENHNLEVVTNKIDQNKENSDAEKLAIDKIRASFFEEITTLDAKRIYDAAGGDISLIKEKYFIVKEYAKRHNVDNFIGVILTAIKSDWKPNKNMSYKSTFNDFEQRNYDWDKLEKALVGNIKIEEGESFLME